MKREYMKARLRGRSFMLPLENVVSVVISAPVAPVPFAPAGVRGIMFYDGRAAALLDTFHETGKAGECGEGARIPELQLVYQSDRRMVAYTADFVEGIVSVTDEEAEAIREQNGEGEPGILRL